MTSRTQMKLLMLKSLMTSSQTHYSILFLLDLPTTFNIINYALLLEVPTCLGFHDSAIPWISSYFPSPHHSHESPRSLSDFLQGSHSSTFCPLLLSPYTSCLDDLTHVTQIQLSLGTTDIWASVDFKGKPEI